MIRYWACQCPKCGKQNLVARLAEDSEVLPALSDYPATTCHSCGCAFATPVHQLQIATHQDFQPE